MNDATQPRPDNSTLANRTDPGMQRAATSPSTRTGVPERSHISDLREEFAGELFESVIPFWERYSPDAERGGYFNHLQRGGEVYDTTKNVWLQGRQAWMFSKLYNRVEPRQRWLSLATMGVDFLRKHAKAQNGRVFFSLTADGRPIYCQRKIFSECFYTMALAEYGRATGRESICTEAEAMFTLIWRWVRHPEEVGRPLLAGAPPLESLAVPMIVLNLIEELAPDDHTMYLPQIEHCIASVERHFVNGILYENVSPSGELLTDIAEGRLLNPGHAIEAGWFLLHWAMRLKDNRLRQVSSAIVRSSFEVGWDAEYGGLFSFLDAGGLSPVQLEWDRKLWWPHCEAMYAFLLLFSLEGRLDDWARFLQITEYTFSHFPDPAHGEWFGYLDRAGAVTHAFKGGPYKGCFHVPRALWLCWSVLRRMEAETHHIGTPRT